MNRFLFSCVLLLSGQIFAQDVILPKQGNPITAYELVVSDAYVFYQTSLDLGAQTIRMAKDDILMIRKADGTMLNLTESTSAVAAQPTEVAVQEDRFPIVDLTNYHGFILKKGNCVYIPTDSKIDYECAGQIEFKRLMKENGYWQVVDKLEQAHFVLMFVTTLSGQDASAAFYRPRPIYERNKEFNLTMSLTQSKEETDFPFRTWVGSGETANENIMAAKTLMGMKWQKNIQDEKLFLKMYNAKKNHDFWILP